MPSLYTLNGALLANGYALGISEDCCCGGYCNFTWTSTYSCSTLEWSEPTYSVVFSQTKAIESTEWAIPTGTRTATWNSEGISGSSQSDCDNTSPPSPPQRLTIYPAELDGVTSSASSRACTAWARSQFRIASATDVVEQVWLVPGGAQVSNTQRNADWQPASVTVNNITGGTIIIYPPTTSTQSFYITYDPVTRRLVYKLQNAIIRGLQTSPESRIAVPANKLTSQTLNYPINIFLGAFGPSLTTAASIRLHDCTLNVTGEPAVQIPNLEAVWPGAGPTATQNFYLTGGKLGKGFTINGYITMGWTGRRPDGSNLQGWFGFVDTTTTPTPVGIL